MNICGGDRVTLKDFRQLNILNYHISDLKEKIRQAEVNAEKCTVSFSDSVVSGSSVNRKEDCYARLMDLRKKLKNAQDELDTVLTAYNRIDDRLVKTAMNLKYDVEHLGRHPISWTATAWIIGGGNTGDGIRMCCKRYL